MQGRIIGKAMVIVDSLLSNHSLVGGTLIHEATAGRAIQNLAMILMSNRNPTSVTRKSELRVYNNQLRTSSLTLLTWCSLPLVPPAIRKSDLCARCSLPDLTILYLPVYDMADPHSRSYSVSLCFTAPESISECPGRHSSYNNAADSQNVAVVDTTVFQVQFSPELSY